MSITLAFILKYLWSSTEKLMEVPCVSVLLTPDVDLRLLPTAPPQMSSLGALWTLSCHWTSLRATLVYSATSGHPHFSKFPQREQGWALNADLWEGLGHLCVDWLIPP